MLKNCVKLVGNRLLYVQNARQKERELMIRFLRQFLLLKIF
jgi:hypothetical protein